VVERVCTACHDVDTVVEMHNTREGWSDVVEDMISRGATASPSEVQEIVTYLAANFGKH